MPGYDRIGIVSTKDAFNHIGVVESAIFNIEQDKRVVVKTHSVRLQCFKRKGVKCSHCGLKGRYFAIERTGLKDGFHLNLYALDKKGKKS